VNASVNAGKPLIAVSMNYRVGYWGFLSGDDLAEEGNTNLGLYDQRLALHWVRENIQEFGGDPDKVTIFGESAYFPTLTYLTYRGAMSVAAQMFAFGGRNDFLFRAAIMESGPPTTGQYNLGQTAVSNASNTAYQAVLKKAGCASAPDRLGCLRALNSSAIYEAFKLPANAPLSTFHPVVDGGFVEQSPSAQLLSGQYVKIPTIQGHNDDEGSLFALGVVSNSDDDTRNYITSSVPLPFLY
jgi:carboxylesterase type B